ncbi:MAG TPA: hypothetical protein VMW27_06110, partial [Thermoanaerobaculia bacterium]|nr:hypothetical protein [Thermoanaerobaculia bacterium]
MVELSPDAGLEGFPLSPQQRRLWRLCGKAPYDPYRAVCEVEIAGDLDAAAFQDALARVARR